LDKYSQNCCRFVGKLMSFSTSKVGAEGYILGKGIIYLPDSNNSNIGQKINIMAWEQTALNLSSLSKDTWINILTSYTPSMYLGNLQDTFSVLSFMELKEND
jgi:hypothetical protein